ncbi:UbiA family prenyltransferase [Methylibium sp.]|uniref:UbiA family prenyltransferase n=1 Tax=Methylibium sp. TaxID=2067992 RepID=UPI003D0C907F
MTTTLPPNVYVDLDGTLIATDLLHESVLKLLRASPLDALRLPAWLMRGKAYMKQQIAQRVSFDWALLPYRPEVLDLVRRARGQGRRVVLATASDESFAAAVARHLGLFDAVLASDGSTNLSGRRKLDAIRADAAGQPFCYVGDGFVDLAVWSGAASAVVVSNSAALGRRVRESTPIEAEIGLPKARLRDYLYGIRLHQWLKNLLVFVPLLPILRSATPSMDVSELWMFITFGLCASSIYVFNDLLDLEADRQHRRKRNRPFASGVIPIAHAMLIGLSLLLFGVAWAFLALPMPAALMLLGYLALTTVYSLWLKRKMLLDVFALASLYTVRILAGAAAIEVEFSFWILAFSIFIFLSLALAKRYVEIDELKGGGRSSIKGRTYSSGDGLFVLAAGVTAGEISILTISLYMNDPLIALKYRHPHILWGLCPLLLYWIVRIWMKAYRNELHDDPVVFTAKDHVSQLIVIASVLLVYGAS